MLQYQAYFVYLALVKQYRRTLKQRARISAIKLTYRAQNKNIDRVHKIEEALCKREWDIANAIDDIHTTYKIGKFSYELNV